MKKVNFSHIIIAVSMALVSINTTTVSAQSTKHNQVWFDATTSFGINENFKANLEVGYRSEPSIQLNQVYLRTMLFYSLNKYFKMSVWAAHYNSSKPNNLRSMEVRTSEFVYLSWPRIRGFTFVHRAGLDQRMYYQSGYDLNKYVHRSRYRIALHSPSFSILNSKKKYYSSASFEILRNLNQKEKILWVDHDWITLSLGYRITKSLALEGQVLLINAHIPETMEFQREISVARFRLKYSIQ